MNRRVMLSTILAGGATAILAPAVFADADWCDDDPLVRIKTLDGDILPVHVTNYALGKHLGALKVVHNNAGPPYITYEVKLVSSKNVGKDDKNTGSSNKDHSDRDGRNEKEREDRDYNGRRKPQEWEITMTITIPGHPIPGDAVEGKFKVKTVVSTEPNAKGTVLGRDEGWSDRPMRVRFTLTA